MYVLTVIIKRKYCENSPSRFKQFSLTFHGLFWDLQRAGGATGNIKGQRDNYKENVPRESDFCSLIYGPKLGELVYDVAN